MKIKFENDLKFQNDAIESIVNIFEGQEICKSNFTVSPIKGHIEHYQNDLGIGNRLELLNNDIFDNVHTNPDIKLFAKLPNWFKIDTPLGNYNPDWAVLIEKDNSEKLYFVVESKGTSLGLDLRSSEIGKIKCGQEHFKALKSEVKLVQSKDYSEFVQNII